MHVLGLHIYETFGPGSVCKVRLATDAPGKNGNGASWTEVWRRPEGDLGSTDPNVGLTRIFSPALDHEAQQMLSSAVELEIDTTGWTDAWWSELDAVCLQGVEPPPEAVTPGGLPASLGGFMARQPWETDQAYQARARFASQLGPAADAGLGSTEGSEDMRRAALSMVWQNHRELGCRYPEQVEAQVGIKAGSASGMAVEGELRAQRAAK